MLDYKRSMYISKPIYILLFSLLGIVYFLGFLFPLMDLDATEYAMVAYRMVANKDYINIISRNLNSFQEYDFLDKPHLSFWLEALSYQIFGVKDWAYRIPSFLFTLLGTYSTYRLGKRLYKEETGWLAALIFLGAQAIILENHDARTDAILGGAVIFGIWQWIEFFWDKKWINLILGVLGMALGMATKGMIAVVVPGVALFFWFLYAREWVKLRDFRWLIGIPLFFIFLSPVLWAYYLQFDLHPEKLVKGQYHVSGVKFLLWSQSFERYAGQGEYVQYPEFSFFFHTYLWAFLPWSLLSYISVFDRGRKFLKNRFRKIPDLEALTWAGGVSLFLLLSAMKYKMPHYINILFPFFAILLASFLIGIMEKGQGKYLRILIYIQGFVILVMLTLGVILNTYSFPLKFGILWILFILMLCLILYFVLRGKNLLVKLIVPSALAGIAVNLLLNGHFYPELLKFQPGNILADYVKEQHIEPGSVYFYGTPSRSYDFYTQRTNPSLDTSQIKALSLNGKPFYIYLEKSQVKDLMPLSLKTQLIKEVPEFRVTKLNLLFLNPLTREKALQKVDLLKIN